ncbi:hypothetical protein GCM10023168_21060 [Fodinibacter luteus]|uniref:Uncharacterized protein n=1 Tax=Fodinibacter luteus TaxID=552064 RepID=A0ABP8KFY3_9MICO
MAKDLSNAANRKKLKKSSFALPEQEKYPIPDIDHARNALARVAQHGSEADCSSADVGARSCIDPTFFVGHGRQRSAGGDPPPPDPKRSST